MGLWLKDKNLNIQYRMKQFAKNYTKLNLHHYPVRGKLPLPAIKWSTRTYEESKTYHKYYDRVENIGFRTKYQPNGAYVIGLDFDIIHTVGNTTTVCKRTQRHFNYITGIFGFDGCFETSTCGNYAIILDISDHIAFVDMMRTKCKKMKIDNLEVLNGFNMVLPPSISMCKKHKQRCNKRKFLTDKHIMKADNKLIEYLMEFLQSSSSTPTQSSYNSTQMKALKNFDETYMAPSDEQLKILKTALDILPDKCFDEYDTWRNIGVSLRSFSNTKVMLDIYEQYSKKSKKYNDNCCKLIWKKCSMNFSFGYVINLIKKYNTDNTNLKLSKLHRPKHIDLLEGLNKLDVPVTNINCEYITTKEGKIAIFDDFQRKTLDGVNGKMYMISSHTGSGKTTAMKEIVNKCKINKISIKSICSRKVLAKFHAAGLDLSYYEDLNMFCDPAHIDVACQLDSIERLGNLEDCKYVLIMDEVNSLINHLRNPLQKMSRNRANMIKQLKNIINNALFVFAVDADMTTSCIKYLSDTTSKSIHVFKNDYKLKNKCDVIVHKKTKNNMIKKIAKNIIKNKPVFVCSDSYSKFEADVLNQVKHILNTKIQYYHKMKSNKSTKLEEIVKKIKFYSAIDGDKTDFMEVRAFSDKFMFVTPTVIYGIDLNYKANVYGFYYGDTINALNSCQQLARIRQPIKIHLWFRVQHVTPQYFDIETLRKDMINGCSNVESMLQMNISQLYGEQLLDSYFDFVVSSHFVDCQLMDLYFHVLDILHHKGHKIKMCDDDEYALEKLNMDAHNTKVLKILDDGGNKDNAGKLKAFNTRMNMLNLTVKHIETNPEFASFIIDDNKFQSVLQYFHYQKNSIKEIQESIKRSTDVNIHILTSTQYQMIHLKQLQEKLHIDDIFQMDYEKNFTKINEHTEKITLPSDMIQAFRLRGKKWKEEMSYGDAYIGLLDVCSHLWGAVMKSKRVQVNGARRRMKYFDNLKTYKQLFDIKFKKKDEQQ